MTSPIESLLTAALAHNIPELKEPARHAQEYLEFLNALMDLISKQAPSPAKAAALLTAVEFMRIDNATPENAKLMTTLVSAMEQLQRTVREDQISTQPQAEGQN